MYAPPSPQSVGAPVGINNSEDSMTDPRIDIAFYLRTLDVGGLQLCFLRLATQLAARNFRVRILVQRLGGELAVQVPKNVEIVEFDVGGTALSFLPLVRLLRSDPPDILMSGLLHANVIVTAAAVLTGRRTRVILTEHAPPRALIKSNAGWRYRVMPFLMRLLYPRADAIVAVSNGVRQELSTILPRGTPVQVIYNPVVPADVASLSKAPVVDPWLGSGAPPLLLGVGRLGKEKRFDILIRAFAASNAAGAPNLLILGEGPERLALETLIDRLGLRSRIRLLGSVPNPFPYMKAAKALIVTSEFEGFCNVLAEAMACGTPVISTDCPFGPGEILDRGRFGTLVAINDVEVTAEAIRRVLTSEVRADELRERSRVFSVESSVDAYVRVIDRMLARKRSTGRGIDRGFRPRLKLSIYMNDLAGGGVERMVLLMIPLLQQKAAEVTLLLHSKKGELLDILPPDLRVINFNTRRTLFDLIPLWRHLRRERPDVLLTNLNHNNIVALMAKAMAGVPTRVVVCQHNALSSEAANAAHWKFRAVPYFYRLFSPFASAIVAVSRGVADDLAALCRIPRERISVIYNPVIADQFDERLAAPDTHPWLEDASVPVFVTVGRLVAQKDHQTLLRAFARYRSRAPARLLVLGAGPLRSELEALARELDIADAISFLGFCDNPLPYMRRAAAFVLSSRYEGFGNVIVEALGCGTPVISTDCDFGPSEILDGGRYGCLVPVGDPEALAIALSPDLRRHWPAEMLRERARVFGVGKAVDRYWSLCNDLVRDPEAVAP
jgi:glycosyltransferase involved in cell wall biosynthesis